jgi:hypothetical protein
MRTPDRRRGEISQLKRDPRARRDALDEIGTDVVREAVAPAYRNPNRDRARGDWDRSRRHADEETSQAGARALGDGPVF